MLAVFSLILVFGMFGVASAITCSQADKDGDGDVDFADLYQFRQCYNQTFTSNCSFWDFNNDQSVNDVDLFSFTSVYQKLCNETTVSCQNHPGCANAINKGNDSNGCIIWECPTPECKNLYWLDSNSKECGYKQFCGAYMYYGLKTFETKDECVKNLPAATCQPTKCDDGTMNKCEIVNNICTCSTCPPQPTCTVGSGGFCDDGTPLPCKIINGKCVCETCPSKPIDMDSCLNNPNYYWDQRTNSCLSYYPGCIDPDGGKNIFVNAHTFGLRSSYANEKDRRIITGGKDSCISDKQIVEHYCDEKGFIQTAYLDCPNGCDKEKGECIKGEPITEKIICKFEGTSQEQKCYLAGQFSDADLGTKYCIAAAGVGSCVIAYNSYKGEQVTWKSSCGSYQYTTQDGNDEVIYFKCSEGATNITSIANKGFSFMYAQCYNGEEWKSQDKTSCKSSELWQEYAKKFCDGKCYKDGSKCGVNSFSVWNECYTGDETISSNETTPIEIQPIKIEASCKVNADCPKINCLVAPCPQYECINGKCLGLGECKEDNDCPQLGAECKVDKGCTYPPKTICINNKCVISNIIEPILVCKDSCPLEGKCYPFGYRKSSNYCSDQGKFISQISGSEKCDNNFECSSNVCVSGKCVSEGMIQKILNWFKRLFGG